MVGIVSRRYSKALFDLGKSYGKIEAYLEQLSDARTVLEQNPEFFTVMAHPKVTLAEKLEIIDGVFAGNFDKEITDFFKLLIEKDRISQLYRIVDSYTELYYEYKNIIKAEITSAYELSDEEREALKTKLQDLLKKTVVLDLKIDQSIIGGLYIRAQDKVIDATLKGRLEKIKSNLLADVQL